MLLIFAVTQEQVHLYEVSKHDLGNSFREIIGHETLPLNLINGRPVGNHEHVPDILDAGKVDSVTVCNLNYKHRDAAESGGQIWWDKEETVMEMKSWKRVPINIGPPI